MSNGLDGTEVVVAALGIVVTCVAALIWIVKFLMKEMRNSLDRNAKATDKNTQVSTETLKYLRSLNGKVAKATIQTIKENQETA